MRTLSRIADALCAGRPRRAVAARLVVAFGATGVLYVSIVGFMLIGLSS